MMMMIVTKRTLEHISNAIRDELHWLPVGQRIVYNQCLLAYQCQCQLAPSYLLLMCILLDITRRHLRSATRGDLSVPRTKTVRYGPRSFAVSGPTCLNSLPSSLKSMSFSPGKFCQRLKTTLLRLAYRERIRRKSCLQVCADINLVHYIIACYTCMRLFVIGL